MAGSLAHVIDTEGSDGCTGHGLHLHACLALDADGTIDQDLREGGREGGGVGECVERSQETNDEGVKRGITNAPSLPPYLVWPVHVLVETDINVAVLQRQRVAEGDELACLLGAHHAGHWWVGKEGRRKGGGEQRENKEGGREGRREGGKAGTDGSAKNRAFRAH